MGEVPGPVNSIRMSLAYYAFALDAGERVTPERIQKTARTRRAFVCVRPVPRRKTTKGDMGPALMLALAPVSSTPLRCERSRRWRLFTMLSDDYWKGLGLLHPTVYGLSRHLSHLGQLAMRLRATQTFLPRTTHCFWAGPVACLGAPLPGHSWRCNTLTGSHPS